MRQTRIRMGHPHDQTPANFFSDYAWVRRNEKMLLEQYGECSILVYQEKVIGVGQTRQEALADAEAHLPDGAGEITPIHERLHHRQPFFRVHPASPESE